MSTLLASMPIIWERDRARILAKRAEMRVAALEIALDALHDHEDINERQHGIIRAALKHRWYGPEGRT